ncbi:hypothetical protein [Nocardiopsis sp. CNT312]|uniref:hypothetical protein n=1 Tax=Nocardiopsis sp. CNT312 TaxID=1137268 RepID=UPI0012DE1E7B|nr:hypothetical protein [Nocardiopsis sp. CNT312]
MSSRMVVVGSQANTLSNQPPVGSMAVVSAVSTVISTAWAARTARRPAPLVSRSTAWTW